MGNWFRFSRSVINITICAAALTAATVPAGQAQLIDPNNNCVYQPGSTRCQPLGPPPMPQTSGAPYEQFLKLVSDSGIDISQHPTYSEAYFNDRSRVYCDLLSRGELMKVVQQIQFPPVVNFTETTNDRPRLEVASLRIGTLNYCRAFWSQEQQIEGTIMR